MLDLLLNGACSKTKPGGDHPPLHMAILLGNARIVRVMLHKGQTKTCCTFVRRHFKSRLVRVTRLRLTLYWLPELTSIFITTNTVSSALCRAAEKGDI